MNKPLITIAISVYNVELYVRQSIDCIINQTYCNLEILCIDDSSKDSTYAILEEYALKDSRIRLFRQPTNQGLAVSRNLVIEKATGEYILMLDGDDLFALDMVEKAYNKIVETNSDFVMWDYCTFYNEKDLPTLLKVPSILLGFDPVNKVELLKKPAFTWVKLFRTDFLRKLNVHFPEGLTKQDIPVWWKVVTNSDKIAILSERLSYYRQNQGATTARKDKSLYSLAYVYDITKKQLLEDGLYETFKDIYLFLRLDCLMGMCDSIQQQYKSEAMNMIRERLDDDARRYLKNNAKNLSFRYKNFYGMIQGEVVATVLYKSFTTIRSVYRHIK